MKRTLDNGGNDQQLAQYPNSGNYIINNQRNHFATLINTGNFSQLVLELKKNPEYVYKSILDYGVIDNNSQYTATLDYLLNTFNQKGYIYHMIKWSFEQGNIVTSNYILDKIFPILKISSNKKYAEGFLNSVSSTGFQEVLINALTHYFSSKTILNYDITYAGAQVLAEVLKTNTSLTRLFLVGGKVKMGHEGAKAIAEALKVNSSLTSLWITGDEMGDEGAKAIAEALKVNSSLSELKLISNRIGDQGNEAIFEALKTNTSLRTLTLSGWGIEDGSKGFAEALKTNTSLTSLDLCHIKIGDEGGTLMAGALKTNTSLRKLKLSGCEIGDDGSKGFAETLKTNTSLTTLDLLHNKIGDEGIKVMAKALKTNTSLTELWMYDNPEGDKVYVAILEALKSNFSLTELVVGGFRLKVNNIKQDIDRFINQNKYYAKTLATFLRENQAELNKAHDGDINKLKEDDSVSPPIGVYSYFTILFKVSISSLKNVIDLKEKFDISKYKEFMAANFFKTVCKSFGNQIIDGKEEIHILKFLPKEVLCKIVYGLPFPSWKYEKYQPINFDELVNNYKDELAMLPFMETDELAMLPFMETDELAMLPFMEFESDMLGIFGEDAE